MAVDKVLGGAAGVKALEEKHVENCKLVVNRLALLDLLPSGSRIAYLGMTDVGFMQDIVQQTQPKELHLILNKPLSDAANSTIANYKTGKIISTKEAVEVYLKDFPDGYFDWIYFEKPIGVQLVRKNISIAKHKLKPDGFLVFRNYIFWIKDRKRCGVVPAVNEFMVAEDWEMAIYALHVKSFCDVAIRKIQ
jgi:hypothetical protein